MVEPQELPASVRRRRQRWIRWLVLATGLLLPALSLIPFGSFWLWQNGYLLYWAIAAFGIVAAWYLLQKKLFAAIQQSSGEPEAAVAEALPVGANGWTILEQQAWSDVLALAAATETRNLASREAAAQLGLDTINAVARRLHPEVNDPAWRFTMPEVLFIIERVSARLRRFIDDTVPFSDRMTVAQALAIYRWRGAVDMLDKAYDVWRIVRLANPATALTHELRERLSRQVVDWGREHIGRVLVEAYVKEVGRAAIDLYGGRLRVAPMVSPAENVAPVAETENAEAPASGRSGWRVPRMARQVGRAGRLLARTIRSKQKRLES